MKAAELCVPCHTGDPSQCGVGMTCYSGVTCSKPTQTAEEILVEVQERVHIGYCGVDFYEAQNNCAAKRPCTLDQDCDEWNPMCFAVTCEDKSQGKPVSTTTTTFADSEGGTKATVLGAFCGAWYEETQTECTTRPPCYNADDCVGYEGCFSDISCTFAEESEDFKTFLANMEALDNHHDKNSTGSEDVENSNLRPGQTTFNARSSARGSYYMHGVAILIPLVVALLL